MKHLLSLGFRRQQNIKYDIFCSFLGSFTSHMTTCSRCVNDLNKNKRKQHKKLSGQTKCMKNALSD
jgi:hypothetical protein